MAVSAVTSFSAVNRSRMRSKLRLSLARLKYVEAMTNLISDPLRRRGRFGRRNYVPEPP